MARTDMVAVALFQEFQVFRHTFLGNVVTGIRPVLVAVGALQLHGHTIDGKNPALDFDFPESRAK